jgi:hypothetical protein
LTNQGTPAQNENQIKDWTGDFRKSNSFTNAGSTGIVVAAIEQRGHLAVAKEMVFRQMNSHLRYPCAQLIVTTTLCQPSSEMRFIPISVQLAFGQTGCEGTRVARSL